MWCADGSCVVPNGNAIKNRLVRLGSVPDNQPGMDAQSEGLFIKSAVAENTPSTLIRIGDANYPESGNPQIQFLGFAGGNSQSSSIRSRKGQTLQFDTMEVNVNAPMNVTGMVNANGLNINKGGTNDLALELRSNGAGWGSGMQFANTATGGRTYGMYSGSDGAMHFTDNTASQDRILIRNNGDVVVNGPLIVNGRNILAELDNAVKYNDNMGLFNSGVSQWMSEDYGSVRTDKGDKGSTTTWNIRRR